jgi:hypothetical protein
MPFFSRHEPEPAQAPVVEQPPKKHGLFSRHEEPAPAPVYQEQPKKHGLFGRNRSPSPVSSTSRSTTSYSTSPQRHSTDASSNRRSLLSKFGNRDEMDPSIVQARERVFGAEAAEREADRALMAARESVRQAREEVRRLELEAEEEARLAKIKQHHAREVSKRGKQLGRKYSLSCR